MLVPSKTSFHLNRLKILLQDYMKDPDADESSHPIDGLFIGVMKYVPFDDLEIGETILRNTIKDYINKSNVDVIEFKKIIEITEDYLKNNIKDILTQEELNSSKINKVRIGLVGTFINFLIENQCENCQECCNKEDLEFCKTIISHEIGSIVTEQKDLEKMYQILQENTIEELSDLLFGSLN